MKADGDDNFHRGSSNCRRDEHHRNENDERGVQAKQVQEECDGAKEKGKQQTLPIGECGTVWDASNSGRNRSRFGWVVPPKIVKFSNGVRLNYCSGDYHMYLLDNDLAYKHGIFIKKTSIYKCFGIHKNSCGSANFEVIKFDCIVEINRTIGSYFLNKYGHADFS